MKIRPLDDRVIVKRIEQQRPAVSGIVMPESATETPEQGELAAVGRGPQLQDGTKGPPQLKVGNLVVFRKHVGQTVQADGEALLVMREVDAVGVLNGQADIASQPLQAA